MRPPPRRHCPSPLRATSPSSLHRPARPMRRPPLPRASVRLHVSPMSVARAPRALAAGWLLAVALSWSAGARAQPVTLDRAVVRFYAPETGGVERPRFIYERRLAFEARIEALSDRDRGADGQPYRERHVSAALERHISEVLLASLRIEPEPSEAVVVRQVELARKLLIDRVGGE